VLLQNAIEKSDLFPQLQRCLLEAAAIE
jgi:hypothetical protein